MTHRLIPRVADLELHRRRHLACGPSILDDLVRRDLAKAHQNCQLS